MPKKKLSKSEEKQTKEKLLAAAKEEFLEKGYTKASLRTICEKAGVTTGALYFFFENKEDLFGALVEEPIKKLLGVMKEHYEEEDELENMADENPEDHLEAAKNIVHFLFQYHDEFTLVLEKSQGTRYENFVDQIIDMTEVHSNDVLEKMSKLLGTPKVSKFVVHWYAHSTVEAFLHLFTHEKSEKAAMKHIEIMTRYITAGSAALLMDNSSMEILKQFFMKVKDDKL